MKITKKKIIIGSVGLVILSLIIVTVVLLCSNANGKNGNEGSNQTKVESGGVISDKLGPPSTEKPTSEPEKEPDPYVMPN